MLFTQNLSNSVKAYHKSSSSQEKAAKRLSQKRAQLERRHTCATMKLAAAAAARVAFDDDALTTTMPDRPLIEQESPAHGAAKRSVSTPIARHHHQSMKERSGSSRSAVSASPSRRKLGSVGGSLMKALRDQFTGGRNASSSSGGSVAGAASDEGGETDDEVLVLANPEEVTRKQSPSKNVKQRSKTLSRQSTSEVRLEGVPEEESQQLVKPSASAAPPAMPPPPLPQGYGVSASNGSDSWHAPPTSTSAHSFADVAWNSPAGQQQIASNGATAPPNPDLSNDRQRQQSYDKDFDDDWDSDDDSNQAASARPQRKRSSSLQGLQQLYAHLEQATSTLPQQQPRTDRVSPGGVRRNHSYRGRSSPRRASYDYKTMTKSCSSDPPLMRQALEAAAAKVRHLEQQRQSSTTTDRNSSPIGGVGDSAVSRDSSGDNLQPHAVDLVQAHAIGGGMRAPSAASGSCTEASTDHEDDDVIPTAVAVAKNKEAPTSSALHGSGGSGSTRDGAGRGTVKRNINRFSNFVKSGTESYVLNAAAKVTTQPAEHHEVVLIKNEAQWEPIRQPYSCIIDKPKKESKLKGLKSFIAYQITPSFNGIQVSRRYKHFDWLQMRLQEKYTLTPIPPLPEKQVAGRYEDELIEHRKQILQLWINKICRHPMLSKSDCFIHFISCTDEKKWKQGKRKAEKDEFSGGNFFLSIKVPSQPLDLTDVDAKIDTFSKMARSLSDSVVAVSERSHETAKRMSGPYKNNLQKLGGAFRQLGQSFEMDQSSENQKITSAMKHMADCYDSIGASYEDQPRKDFEPMADALYAYKGMLSAVPDIITVAKSANSKLHDHEKMQQEGKVAHGELEGMRQRVSTLNYAMLSEINHFHKERIVDFKDTMGAFLTGQIEFYQQIVAKLQRAASEFESS